MHCLVIMCVQLASYIILFAQVQLIWVYAPMPVWVSMYAHSVWP